MLESGIRICEKWIPAQILKTDDPAQYLPAVHRTRGVLSYCIGTVEDILFLSLSGLSHYWFPVHLFHIRPILPTVEWSI